MLSHSLPLLILLRPFTPSNTPCATTTMILLLLETQKIMNLWPRHPFLLLPVPQEVLRRRADVGPMTKSSSSLAMLKPIVSLQLQEGLIWRNPTSTRLTTQWRPKIPANVGTCTYMLLMRICIAYYLNCSYVVSTRQLRSGIRSLVAAGMTITARTHECQAKNKYLRIGWRPLR